MLNRYKYAETEEDHEIISKKKKKSSTLGEFLLKHLDYSEKHNSPKWFQDKSIFFRAHIVPFFGEDTPLKDINQQKVEAYKSKRLKTVSPRTVNLELTCLKTLLRQAVEWGELDQKYLPKFKKLSATENRLRFLSKEEINALMDAAEKYDSDMLAYVRLMLYAGLRLGEALNLRWDDVNLDQKILTIAPRKDWNTKTKRGRIVPIPEDLHVYLTQRKMVYPDSEYVVLGTKRYTKYRIKRLFMKVTQDAGLPTEGENKVTAHTLRHTYASHLVMNGTPLYTVSALLGHSDAKTTQIYAHLAPDYLRDSVNGLKF